MWIKKELFKELVIIFFSFMIFILVVFASHIPGESSPTTDWDINQPQRFQYSNPNANIPSVPVAQVDFQQIQQYNREGELTEEQLEYKDEFGEPNINKINDWKKLNQNARDKVLSKTTGKSITTEEPVGGKVVGNGVEFEFIKFWKIDRTSLNNCIKCSYNGSKLKFQHADSILTDKSASTNIDNFDGYEDIFSVEQADSFLSDCIRVDNIKDSEFRVGIKVEVTTKSNVNLKITDCTFNEYQFSGKGRVTIDKSSDSPKYIIENGTLTKIEIGYNETIESSNSVVAETDKTFGFKCFTITPAGTYFYNDNDLRKDFAVNIPKESGVYKLCLRKNKLQQFNEYNGLADFVEKKIELNGIANYLRYPLKNNQIASLLSGFVYKGLKDVNTIFSYDNNLIFLNNIFLTNKNKINGNLSITYPSNYYTIKEMEVGSEIHSVIQLNLVKKDELTQNINYEYKTDYFAPKAAINDNVLVQDNGKNRLVIFPPGHEKISEMLKNE